MQRNVLPQHKIALFLRIDVEWFNKKLNSSYICELPT